jgi:hypothetical protein|tara:strand:+ start:1764 stop:3692 length:1929 start_codon:yes stop_codon:yes gene_type:complete
MNNEVLRRKLFRTVLADSRSPAGILASSPEMVDTVSRRANGGLEARRRLAGQQFMRQFAGMPEGSRKPESYLQVLDRIKGLPYNQQVQELTKAGYGATIGPDVPAAIGAATDEVSRRAGIARQTISDDLSEVLAPGADKPIIDAIQSGIVSVKDALGLIGPADAGMPGGEAPVKNRTPLSATDLVVPTDDDEFGNIAPDGTMPTNVSPNDVGSETTAAEELAATQSTQSETQSDAEKDANKESPPKKPGTFTTVLTPELITNLTEGTINTEEGSKLAQTTGNAVIDQALSILQNTTDAKTESQKAKGVDETIGITGNRKERIEKRKAVLKELLGERAKDIRTDANYNLMMTGLMIAAGESPDMMTNIAKGVAMGLKGYGEAAGEEAQAVTKEDRALTMMAAEEVGAEITSEKAAALKAEQQKITRQHEQQMQDKRLATSLLQTQIQTGSREAIALANIASKEKLAGNAFEQNVALFGLKADQEEKIFEMKADLERELAEVDTETMKLMKVVQADAKADGDEMSDLDALIAVKQAGATTGKATDTTNSYNRLVAAGMKPMDAWLLSNSGAVTELIKDMGSDDFQNFLMGKLAQGSQQPQNTQNTQNTVTGAEAQKHIDANAAALASGQTTYEVDGKKFGVVQN